MPSVPLLSLEPQIRVTHIDCYGQGKIWWFQFEDASGLRTTLSLDNRPESPTRFRLFQGSRFPNRPESVLLDLGGDEEAIAVPLISHWLDSDEFARLREYGQELFLSDFNRYGEPLLPHDLQRTPPDASAAVPLRWPRTGPLFHRSRDALRAQLRMRRSDPYRTPYPTSDVAISGVHPYTIGRARRRFRFLFLQP